jgi:rRNA maturation protein Nop10
LSIGFALRRGVLNATRPIALLAAAAAAALAPAVGALAQEGPPVITVRPSGVLDEGAEARRRQEQLLRRLEQSEYQFRSICRVCGSPERFEVAAPFEPYRALAAPSPRERAPATLAPETSALPE